MMSYLIFFAFIALIVYYGYILFKIIKKFIDKKLKEKKVFSKINVVVGRIQRFF